jgi:serine-type D-Ala-D-Ala carboxypeptidase
MTIWDQVEEVLQTGLNSGVYTAGVCLAGREGEMTYQRAVGRLSGKADSPETTLETVFDLASITKTMATTLALVLLVQQGRLPLQADLGGLLPASWLPEDKRCLPLVSLLTHQSGLPAWEPFYAKVLSLPPAQRSTALERLAADTPLEHTPGKLTIYSDLGFMLLKAVVEAASGEDLDSFCRRNLFEPLGLKNMGFNPLQQPGGPQHQYPATEVGLIPDRTVQGEVHDENAWSAGGVAGHAGLFGTGPEVFRLAGHLYLAFKGRDTKKFFDPEVVRIFLTPPPAADRALGFDVPSRREASCGRFFSPRSVGHLGFTGVSYWLDLDQGQLIVLLTNRVHLGRDNDKIKPFRPLIYEAASRALGFTHKFRP